MKSPPFNTALLSLLLFGSLGFGTSAVYAHSGETHKKNTYEAVSVEFGNYQPTLKESRVIEMDMSDLMRFTPSRLKVKKGDTLKISLRNSGALLHEFVLGTQASLNEHAELMKKFPTMEHDEPFMAHVKPGETGEIIWQFSEVGEFAFGCLIPGHYDAGMKGIVIVE